MFDALTEMHAALPWTLMTVAILLVQAGIRRYFPTFWERAADLPFPMGYGRLLKLVRKVWQGLPSVLFGALGGAVLAGEDPRAAWYGAFAGACAPILVELRKGLHNLGGPPASAAVLLLCWPLVGCAGSFEEARLAGMQDRRVGAKAPDLAYCRSLDSAQATWGGIGKSSALLAGGAGLATIQTEGHLKTGLAAGSVAAGAVAAGAIYVSEAKGESWLAECSQ